MKILVLGSDGRAHALVWKLFHHTSADILVAPGNGGSSLLAPVVELDATNAVAIARWAFSEQIDLIVPADTTALAAGLVDEVVAMHIGVCGPALRATRLETSRCFARAFLERHGLPLAPGRVCEDLATAEKYLAAHALPVVIRADQPEDSDGVYTERYPALEGLRASYANRPVAGPEAGVVIESYLPGPTFSFAVLTDGSTALPLLPVHTYDRLGPEPASPHAPGMGAATGNSAYAQKLGHFLHTRIMQPLVAALTRDQIPYWGFLGIDGIITQKGPVITGLRCSLRDMEAQAVLPRLEDDLEPLIEATIARRLDQIAPLHWKDEASVALALVTMGYPHHYSPGAPITGLSELDEGILVFHDQTRHPAGLQYAPTQPHRGLGTLFTGNNSGSSGRPTITGGHVLTVVAMGATLAGARGRALLNAERITFPGRTYREDIGLHLFQA
ncbi:phosphoribosylamine--glycine ligase [Candidatus Chloroploca sp. M-50]|uniref:phosphoribosylamine--glycine ligase n=1 Tax=Candidatus Chloroploca mongolica TaxID=2528176 RepID=A0ABS4D929_9CHLR|nr:phosphoribosylamine--glycine ligase [Candidatus Chloroploca mongolica]